MIGEDQYEIGTNYPTEKDPKKANIEAEKGELILTKDFELYKINGKPHSKGGTPLSVNEGDFIFSKKLEAPGSDFNKIFGNFNEKKKYSYADVASRFLKMNDHKVLSQNSNPIDRKTGERMYEDYKDKLGMLAFLQEVSKGLPNGIPSISAPMIDRLTQSPMGIEPAIMPQQGMPPQGIQLPGNEQPIEQGEEIANASQQFMKRGGPVLEKFWGGGWSPSKWKRKAYDPTLEYLQYTNPSKTYDIKTHGDYQNLVINDPILFGNLKQKYTDPNEPMEITNLGRDILKKAGVNNAEKIKYWSELPSQYQTDDFLKQQYVDKLAGYRAADIIPTNYKKGKVKEPFLERVFKRNEEAPYNERLNPNLDLDPEESQYRDLGYNTNENLAMMNALGAMSSIPYFAPTRMQNYGLQEGMGLAANLMPYNYQSLINEANRSGMRGFDANNAFASNPNIAAARNAMITGQLAEQTSKIKGEEYNQNANLYNANQMQLAELASKIGQDKMQNAEVYNNKVTQGRENLWANRKLANKEFIQELANANNNRTMRNTIDFLMQSRDPNYRFANADLASGFSQFADPFEYIAAATTSPTIEGVGGFLKELEAIKEKYSNISDEQLLRAYQLYQQSKIKGK
jgi:hypothetical protein